MVLSLLQDGHLIGFWPLNEPSGSPYFRNYGYTYGGKPSGISFDFHVHNADDGDNSYQSEWPGRADYFDAASGITYRGFLMQSEYEVSAQYPHANVLCLGHGDFNTRRASLPGSTPNSGITAGFWVKPTTNGYQGYINNGNGKFEQARGNAVLYRGDDDFVIMAGVSGSLAGGAQFDSSEFGGPPQLRAYAYVAAGKTANPVTSTVSAAVVETPIESGAFQHIAFSFEYVDGNNNVLKIYKNGQLAASQTTAVDSTFNTSSLANNFWSIGGTSDASASNTREYLGTTGWNKLVSGVYLFNRVLSDAEVENIHNYGGFQIGDGRFPEPGDAIALDDDKLGGLYGFWAHDYEEVSTKKAPLITPENIGDDSFIVTAPGPFNSIGFAKVITSPFESVVSSGVTNTLVDNQSFSLGGHFRLSDIIGNEYLRSMAFSLGSVGTNESQAGVTDSTACFVVTVDGITQNIFAKFFPFGDTSASTVELVSPFYQISNRVSTHIGIAYDDQTNGVALYLDGEQAASGTVDPNFRQIVNGVIGSGFPVCVLGGVSNQDINSWAFTSFNPAGINSAINSFTVIGRPLKNSEFRALAASGIDISPIYRTPHDPRIMGYWPCSDFQLGDSNIEDRAANWRNYAGNMAFSLSDGQWDVIQATDTGGPWFTIDPFGESRATIPELASFGNLGVTSGCFTLQGGSPGSQADASNANQNSSAGNFSTRFRFLERDTDLAASTPATALWLFEVTPSGSIPQLSDGHGQDEEFNSSVLIHGDSDDNLKFYLTSINANNPDPQGFDAGTGASGISLVVTAENTAIADIPLASGNVSYGVPNKVAFLFEKAERYNIAPNSSDLVRCRLYIDETPVFERLIAQNTADIWFNDAGLSVDATVTLGSVCLGPSVNADISSATVGLGDIYVRNVAFLRGLFFGDDLEHFVSSGILDISPVPGYTAQDSSTAVNIGDSDLRALWRFNGAESGERDLTINGNDFTLLAKQVIDTGAFSNNNVEGAYNMRFMPGPLANSDLGVRCSGITYNSDNLAFEPVPFFVGSGIGHDPTQSFTVCLRFCARAVTVGVSNDADVVLCYGVCPPNAITTSTNDNYSWTISYDASESLKLTAATNGGMYLSNISNAAQANQIEVGAQVSTLGRDDNTYELFRKGSTGPPHKDSFDHYAFTVDYSNSLVRAYMNGVLIDEKRLPGTIQDPLDDAAKLLSVFTHQTDSPWNFTNSLSNDYSIITDVALFDRALTEAEVRYIAFNGIDSAPATEASGIIGGYVQGQDVGSGIIGGYSRGQETASGIIGAFIPGAFLASGIAGGYVSGVVFGEGTIGGFVQGLDIVSGIMGGWITGAELGSGVIAGYIAGQDVGSGLIGGLIVGVIPGTGTVGGYVAGRGIGSGLTGGYILGGLKGNFDFDAGFTIEAIAAENFDAQLEIAKTIGSDFDAKLIIFQDESTPLVDIIVPDITVSGLVPPFNQYFVGVASGQQGKTISKTRWNFGDLSPTVSVSESGAGFYPVQHQFTGSGFYIVRFEAIDSDGIHNSATRIVNAASGIDPVIVSLSGVPRSGPAGLIVDFETNIDIVPENVSIVSQLLSYGDGQSTISFNPTHVYTEPGTYKPIWCVRDSRGVIWCDSLEAGNDFLLNGGY